MTVNTEFNYCISNHPNVNVLESGARQIDGTKIFYIEFQAIAFTSIPDPLYIFYFLPTHIIAVLKC